MEDAGEKVEDCKGDWSAMVWRVPVEGAFDWALFVSAVKKETELKCAHR